MTRPPVVSVVIPTFNRCRSLERALDALRRQTLDPASFEVVVVDDASDDGTAEMLAARRDPYALGIERHGVNRGPAAARNTGLRRVVAPVVAFTDSDCEPAPSWLTAGLDAIAEGAVVVQGRTLPTPDATLGPWSYTQRIESLSGLFETCNMFFLTRALRDAGGFDESIGNFGEDTAAALAVLRRGGTATFASQAVVHHEVSDPGVRWFLRWARLYENWPELARRFPEVRDQLLWHRWFLRRSTASVMAAFTGMMLGVRWRPALALAVPYVVARRPKSLRPGDLRASAAVVAFDLAVECALVRGSIRARTVVL